MTSHGTNYEQIVERATERCLFYAWLSTLAVACFMGAINGWSRGQWWGMCLLWAVFFFAIPLIEFALVHKAAKYVRGRHYGSAVGAVSAALLAFTVSVWSTFNTAASNQDARDKMRLASTEQQEDGKAAVNRLAAKVLEEREALKKLRWSASAEIVVAGTRITSPDAAQAMIDSLQAHRLYRLSEECTASKGKQTAAHCATLAEAKAARESAAAALLAKEEAKSAERRVAEAEAALEKARTERAAGPVVTSAQSPFVKKAAYYFNMPEEDANTIESGLPALGLQLLTMVLAVFIGGGALTQSVPLAPQPRYGHDPMPRPVGGAVPASGLGGASFRAAMIA
jgi:hypothetical protein